MEYFHNTRVIGFNPHTHAGCDVGDDKRYERMIFVSIHTPTQGVTDVNSYEFRNAVVSIHTPTQGVTITNDPFSTISKFQSTHPRRV